MKPLPAILQFSFPRARRRLLLAAVCALCVCAFAALAVLGYRHFRPDPHDNPYNWRDTLRYPVFEPIMNARQVTLEVVRVDGAREPKGTIEAVARVYKKYIRGKMRIVEETTVTLNRPFLEGNLKDVTRKNRFRGPSVITLVIVPRSPLCEPSYGILHMPWNMEPPCGFSIIVQADEISSPPRYAISTERLWRHVILHEMCHALFIPQDPSRRIDYKHCSTFGCILYPFGCVERKKRSHYVPQFGLCRECAKDIEKMRTELKAPLQDYGEQYDMSGWYDELVRLNPEDINSQITRAHFAFNRGNFAGAIADFTRIINHGPKAAIIYSNRAKAYGKLGEHQKAIADFTQAIDLDKDDPQIWHDRSLTHYRMGNYKQAISDSSEALRLDPKNSAFARQRGLAYRELGDTARALEDYNRAIHFGRFDARAWNSRGGLYLDFTGDPAKALDDLTRAVALDPGNPFYRTNRALAHWALRQHQKAFADLERALQLDPEYPNANYWFAWFMLTCPEQKLRNADRAMPLAKHLCEQSEWKDSEAIALLAAAYNEKKDYAAAVKYMEQAVNLTPDAERRKELMKTLISYRERANR